MKLSEQSTLDKELIVEGLQQQAIGEFSLIVKYYYYGRSYYFDYGNEDMRI